MIAEGLKSAANPGNTSVKDIAIMTEGKPQQRKSPARGAGLLTGLSPFGAGLAS
jgi:hypothetical protein